MSSRRTRKRPDGTLEVSLSLRCPAELADKFEEAVKAKYMTMTSRLLQLMEEEVQKYEESKKGKKR